MYHGRMPASWIGNLAEVHARSYLLESVPVYRLYQSIYYWRCAIAFPNTDKIGTEC